MTFATVALASRVGLTIPQDDLFQNHPAAISHPSTEVPSSMKGEHHPQQQQQSTASSVCDFDIGFGEILEYHEDIESSTSSVSFSDPFASAFVPSFEQSISSSSFDGKGKAPASKANNVLDQYHPENSKNEVLEHVVRSMSNQGLINASQLRHSSEQWSNYTDLCESVKLQLHRDGYANATVECVTFGTERHICYELN